MFVRWQSRKRKTARYGEKRRDVYWKAILAESARINGKPTQRHVAYLGGIAASGIKVMTGRCSFWDQVADRLDQLGNQIMAEDRQRIEAAIAKKVSPPTPAEYKAEARRKAQKVGWKYLRERQRAALQDEADQWQGKEGELFADIQSLLEGAPSSPRCSFCGKTAAQVETLVAGGGANICDECVEQAVSAIAQRKAGCGADKPV